MTDAFGSVDRFVWTGRFPDAWPGGADGWSHPRPVVLERLASADEVVILDAASFPWQDLEGSLRDVRLVVRLPETLDADEIGLLLGAPLLRSLTPYDQLLEGRAEVRKALTEEFSLPDVWIPYDEPAQWRPVLEGFLAQDDAARAEAQVRKPRFNQLVQAVTEELEGRVDREGLVAVGGEGALRAQSLEARIGCSAYRLEAFEVAELPAPDAVVVLLRDGGQTRQERAGLFRSAHRLLHPGGALVVVGYVVSEEDAPTNPWIGELVDELQDATGTSVHLEELRSIRWVGESLSRGVLLRFSSLRLREV